MQCYKKEQIVSISPLEKNLGVLYFIMSYQSPFSTRIANTHKHLDYPSLLIIGKCMSEIIILNLFLSSFMFGLIVTTQLVTYPLFSSISSSGFTNYHFNYVSKISRIAGPAMLLELIIASFLFYNFGNLFSKLIFLVTILIFLSTLLIQVPIHDRIKYKANNLLFKKLVMTNWIRTLLWSLKCILSISLFFKEILI